MTLARFKLRGRDCDCLRLRVYLSGFKAGDVRISDSCEALQGEQGGELWPDLLSGPEQVLSLFRRQDAGFFALRFGNDKAGCW